MLTFELTPEIFTHIKDTLRIVVPDAGSSRRVEAAARGLGFNTHAALRASLSEGPASVTVDTKAFSAFLTEAGVYPGEKFHGACAVQVILATIRRFPHIPMDGLDLHLGNDAQSWGHPRTQMAAFTFIVVLERLLDPTFLRGFPYRVNAYQILLATRNAPPRDHDVSLAAAAALHAGLKPIADQLRNRPVTFHRPSPAPEAARDLTSRHGEFGFVFECRDALFGRHARYGHGTFGEASRYADLLRASRDGTCISHSNLTKSAWDAVRQDEGIHVFDLCEEIASLEGRPYPGRPWSEERAKVRDSYPFARLVGPRAISGS